MLFYISYPFEVEAMELITSQANPLIKSIKRLARRRQREKEQKFLIEGSRFVEEALKWDWPLDVIICDSRFYPGQGDNIIGMAGSKGIKVVQTTERLLAELAETENPQGVAAVARMIRWEISHILKSGPFRNPVVLLVDGVQDPGNLGTIIRSADGFGAGGVILTRGTADLYNPKTLRSTMGSVFHLPIAQNGEIREILPLLTENKYTLLVGDPSGGLPVNRADLLRPVVLVVGSEASGPSRELMSCEHIRVTIPMPGKAESLNVGVASSILLYEVVRQRNYGGGA